MWRTLDLQTDLHFGRIFGRFTVMAIGIACLGLFGLGVLNVTQRTREVGPQDVGASAILVLYSKDSVPLLVISYFVSVPLVYIGVGQWLNNFAFHIGMDWQIFLLPPVFLLTISILAVVLFSLRAALMNR